MSNRLPALRPATPYALVYEDTSSAEALRCSVRLLERAGWRDILLATFTSPQERDLPRQLGTLTLERFEGVVLVQVAIDAPGEGQAIALAGRLHDCIAGFEVRCVAVASAPRAIDLSSAFVLNGFVELPGRTLGTLKEAAA